MSRARTGAGRSAVRLLDAAVHAAMLVAFVLAGLLLLRGLQAGTTTWSAPGVASLLVAAIAYLVSHGLRIVRLAILVGDPRVSLRSLACVHQVSSAIGLLLPLKLGDLVRIRELGVLTNQFGFALMVVWVERAFDAAVISALIAAALLVDASVIDQIQPLVVMAAAFVLVTIVLLSVVPEGLRTCSLFIIRRYDGPRAIRALRVIQWLRAEIGHGPRMVRGKITTLLVLTLGVWCLELAALALLLPAEAGFRDVVTGLPAFLSSSSLGAADLFLGQAPLSAYAAMVSGVLLLAGLGCGLAYLPTRFALQRWRPRLAPQRH